MPQIREYSPRQAFIPFHNRQQRWGVLVTHRRAGKTVALCNDLVLAARTPTSLPDPQFAYIGPTFTQAKRVAWAYLKQYSQPYWAKPPSESELKITLSNDSTIYCLGADNADSLRGMYLDGAVGDEYALWRPSIFSLILRPALSDRFGWGVFASTPRGKNHFHDMFRLASRNPSDYHLTNMRADSSGIIHPSELKDLQKDMDPEEFAQEYLCSFDSALKGAIYAQEINNLFSEGRLSSETLYSPYLDTHFVYDLGFTDNTVRIAYQLPPHSGLVNIVNVEARSGVSILEHIDSLHQFASQSNGKIGEIWLPHDARAKSLQTGRSIVEQFLAHDLTPRIVPNHHVHDGISATRSLFPRLQIDNTPFDPSDPLGTTVCGDFIEAAKTYHREWDDDLLMFKDQPVHDWSSDYMDALRYLAIVIQPDTMTRRSSDNRVSSDRDAQSRIWLPHLGYNLETLHTDARATQNQQPRLQ
jgi:phage terminase large subunit